MGFSRFGARVALSSSALAALFVLACSEGNSGGLAPQGSSAAAGVTASGGSGSTGGSAGTILKTLGCGGLSIGGGDSTVPEGPTPANAPTQFNTACAAGSCTVTARTAVQTGSNNNCSDTGCQFGPFLSIANGATSTCVLNTFLSPGSGTLDSVTGELDGSFPLSSKVTLTGNVAEPCPPCMVGGVPGAGAGVCNAAALNPGAACTGINAAGDEIGFRQGRRRQPGVKRRRQPGETG